MAAVQKFGTWTAIAFSIFPQVSRLHQRGTVTLKLIEEQYMKNAAEVGRYTLDALQEIMMRHPMIGQVRGIGLMIGVEFVKDRLTKEPAVHFRDDIVDHAFERGLLTLGCGKSTIRISPLLSTSRSEIDEGLQILEEAIAVTEKLAIH
jgi:4-aminobutyrate aminotransferase